MVKKCYKCKETKPLELFYSAPKRYDKHSSDCKSCRTISGTARRRKDPKKYAAQKKKRRDFDILKSRESERIYRAKNPIIHRIAHSKWAKNNKGTCNSIKATRRALKNNAYVKGLKKEHKLEIKKIYQICAWLNAWKLEKFHVDHIIPIKGENVCGLHVPWNLQIIPAIENIKKGNKLCLR